MGDVRSQSHRQMDAWSSLSITWSRSHSGSVSLRDDSALMEPFFIAGLGSLFWEQVHRDKNRLSTHPSIQSKSAVEGVVETTLSDARHPGRDTWSSRTNLRMQRSYTFKSQPRDSLCPTSRGVLELSPFAYSIPFPLFDIPLSTLILRRLLPSLFARLYLALIQSLTCFQHARTLGRRIYLVMARPRQTLRKKGSKRQKIVL